MKTAQNTAFRTENLRTEFDKNESVREGRAYCYTQIMRNGPISSCNLKKLSSINQDIIAPIIFPLISFKE